MKRVVVTGGGSPIGRRIVQRLEHDPGIEAVRGVEASARDKGSRRDDVDVVPLVPDHRPFVEYLEKEQIDTVVQCGLTPDRSGRLSRPGEADVITTMCLGTAIAHEATRVRSWVLLSSTSIYPIGSKSSLLQREDQVLKFEELEARASIAEAEDYARDVAVRNTHINVSILRLQQLIGRGLTGPLCELLSREVVPTPIGFDPSIQLLHAEDAADAAAFAAINELAGVYNIASSGSIHWHDAVRATDRQAVPVLPVSLSLLEPALRLLRIPFVPSELFDLLRFGHAVDTQKIERVGWYPKHDQRECLKSIA